MLNSLFDHCNWKELSFLGAASLPLIGVFFLHSKDANWNTPLGYFTQLRLFIKKEGSSQSQATSAGSINRPQKADRNYQLTQVSSHAFSNNNFADLLVEYPLTSLEKESNWKYCIPSGSKLSESSSSTTSSEQSLDCNLQWNKTTDSKIQFLLKLGQRFLKLQHQMNLIFLYHLGFQNSNQQAAINDQLVDWKQQVLEKCRLSPENYDLKDFFVSTVPISKKCLLTPSKVELTLTIKEATSHQANNVSNQAVDLDSLKRSSLRGDIKYSLSNYRGELHDFSWPSNSTSTERDNCPILIFLKTPQKPFEFILNSGTSSGNSKLDFEALWKKYSSRDLTLCDFCKNITSNSNIGGGDVNCCQKLKK